MDRGAWQATVHGVAKNQTWLGTHKEALLTSECSCLKGFSFFSSVPQSTWNFPDQGSNPCLLQWKRGVLTTGQTTRVGSSNAWKFWSNWLKKKLFIESAAAAAAKSIQSCSTPCNPHRQKPTRLLCSWDSPGKNTGVGCHFLLQCLKVKSESEVAQSCQTLSDPMDCSLPGSSVHGIFQARVLEWGASSLLTLTNFVLMCVVSDQWSMLHPYHSEGSHIPALGTTVL